MFEKLNRVERWAFDALALTLAPFIFGYVPALTLNGSPTDIAVAFVLIIIGTWA